jgi:hypothetical protein
MDVHYYLGGNTRSPIAAKITQVDGNSVVVNCFHPNNYNCTIRDGVRHVSDPRTKDHEKIENGLWDYTPHYKRLLALHRTIDELQKTWDELKGAIDELKAAVLTPT